MKHRRWFIITAGILVTLSATAYFIHYLIFGDPHHIFIYLLGDIAFVPLEVLFVVIVIERLIARHEHHKVLEKMNMLVGTFFSELGTELLGKLTDGLKNKSEIRSIITVNADWRLKQYRRAIRTTASFDCDFDMQGMNLPALRDFLASRRDFMVLLLANPNLMEHDRFTNLLWAVFHCQEELAARKSLESLPQSDFDHLAGDLRRVYVQLTAEWLHYCRHLQVAYPYIFSIVTRTHPLQENPDPIVSSPQDSVKAHGPMTHL